MAHLIHYVIYQEKPATARLKQPGRVPGVGHFVFDKSLAFVLYSKARAATAQFGDNMDLFLRVALVPVLYSIDYRLVERDKDLRIFGSDYADTLKIWRERYDAAVREGRLNGFDKRFHNLWRYYLMYCEGGFRGRGIDVAQVTMVRAA